MKDSNIISVWGLLRHYRKNSKDFFGDLFKAKGDMVTIKTPYKSLHIFLNPTCVEHVLFTNRDNYAKTPSPVLTDEIVNSITDYNLVTTDNYPIWKKDRDTLNPYFKPEYLKKHITTLVQTTSGLLNNWDDFAHQKKPMNIDEATSSIAYENALATIFGGISMDFHKARAITRKTFYLVYNYLAIGIALCGIRPVFFARRHRRLVKEIRSVMNELVEKCLAPSAAPDNLIKLLYNANKDNHDETQLKQHLYADAITFISAAQETLNTLLCWTFTYLSLYPEIAERVYAEINDIVGSREPTYEDIEKLKYTHAFFQEVLRIQPVFSGLYRTAINDDVIGSNKIKKGDFVLTNILFMHRLPQYWPNPEGFQPERFLEPLPDEYKYVYIPFGAGPRTCIGQHFAMLEASVILILTVQRFRLTLLPGFFMEREETLPLGKLKISIEMMVHHKTS